MRTSLRQPIDLLLDALGREGTCFLLGAGASMPHVPTMGDLPRRIAAFADRLNSFPVGIATSRESPLRRLIEPVIVRALTTISWEEWKAGTMTPAAIGVVLEHLISVAQAQRLPQYEVFELFPPSASIVSFNWDGLARALCRQRVIHAHGELRPRSLSPRMFEELLDSAQMLDAMDTPRALILPHLVFPGEEDSPRVAGVRERILHQLLTAPQAVVVGYRFGIGSPQQYDRVWLDTFAEAMRANPAPIHIIDPEAIWLRGELIERIGRRTTVHAWPLSWHSLAITLLASARAQEARAVRDLRIPEAALYRAYRVRAEADGEAVRSLYRPLTPARRRPL